MKRLKKYFNLIVTAVISFFMGLIPGKRVHGEMVKVLENGYDAGSKTRKMPGCREDACGYHEKFNRSDIRNTDYMKKRKWKRPRIQKIFFWLGGPGDRFRPEPIYEKTE